MHIRRYQSFKDFFKKSKNHYTITVYTESNIQKNIHTQSLQYFIVCLLFQKYLGHFPIV